MFFFFVLFLIKNKEKSFEPCSVEGNKHVPAVLQMTWCAIVMHVICSLSRQSRESLSDRHFVFIYTNICKYMRMLEEAKPKKRAWHLESFTVVPLFGGKKRGTQTTTSQHPPHLLCSLLPPNVDRSMEGSTQSPPSEGPPSRFFHLLNPSRVITTGTTQHTS